MAEADICEMGEGQTSLVEDTEFGIDNRQTEIVFCCGNIPSKFKIVPQPYVDFLGLTAMSRG